MPTKQVNEVVQHLRRCALLRHEARRSDADLLGDYVDQGDIDALTVLTHRHGPMVWGVCRRMLSHWQDAEDAFQATFLVLVRRAESIASRELLANWLYGVAHQTALKARANAAKRASRERQVKTMPESAQVDRKTWRDLQPILDEELSRLPDKYRSVIVLCDLEGKTRKEVAQQLKCPEGTVAGRLARARRLLAKKLERHGFAVSGGLLALLISRHASGMAVPSLVISSAAKIAREAATGNIAGSVAERVMALVGSGSHAVSSAKTKTLVSLLTMIAAAGAGFSIMGTGDSATSPQAFSQIQNTSSVLLQNRANSNGRVEAGAARFDGAQLSRAVSFVDLNISDSQANPSDQHGNSEAELLSEAVAGNTKFIESIRTLYARFSIVSPGYDQDPDGCHASGQYWREPGYLRIKEESVTRMRHETGTQNYLERRDFELRGNEQSTVRARFDEKSKKWVGHLNIEKASNRPGATDVWYWALMPIDSSDYRESMPIAEAVKQLRVNKVTSESSARGRLTHLELVDDSARNRVINVWLDPSENWLVRRLKSEDKTPSVYGDRFSVDESVDEFAEVSTGVFFPKKATRRFYRNEKPMAKTVFEFSDVKINSLSDCLFPKQLPITDGMHATNVVRGDHIVDANGNPKVPLSEIAHNPIVPPPTYQLPKPPSSNSATYWIGGLFLTISVALVVYLLFVFWHPRKSARN
jgi:RNA polymerase sigma factor (sigma-70 family)